MSYYLLDHPNPNGKFYHTTRLTCQHGINGPHLIVIHTAENKADTIPADDGAEAVAKYASNTTRQVSWHVTGDSDSIIDMLPDEYTAFHARDYNRCALGYEQAVQADMWPSYSYDYRTAVIRNTAKKVAEWSQKHGIPIKRINRAAADRGEYGIISHADLDPTRRTDPGASYPWYYLLEQAEKAKAGVGGRYPIIDRAKITIPQAVKWLKDRRAHQRMIDVTHVWFQECATLGVEPSIAIAQAAHETGFGHYSGVVPPEFNNWAGIKTAQGGDNYDPNAHAKFPSAQVGIRAQVEHLHLYAKGAVPHSVDPRHFVWLAGVAPHLEHPRFTWAGDGYGSRLIPKVEQLRATVVAPEVVPPLTDEEIVAIRRLLRSG